VQASSLLLWVLRGEVAGRDACTTMGRVGVPGAGADPGGAVVVGTRLVRPRHVGRACGGPSEHAPASSLRAPRGAGRRNLMCGRTAVWTCIAPMRLLRCSLPLAPRNDDGGDSCARAVVIGAAPKRAGPACRRLWCRLPACFFGFCAVRLQARMPAPQWRPPLCRHVAGTARSPAGPSSSQDLAKLHDLAVPQEAAPTRNDRGGEAGVGERTRGAGRTIMRREPRWVPAAEWVLG